MNGILPSEWAELIARDYGAFVLGGGAVIRFVVALDIETYEYTDQLLRKLAADLGLLHFDVSGAIARLHYPSELLREVAQDIDWVAAVTGYLREIVLEEGYDFPADDDEFFVERVAALNNVDVPELVTILKREIRRRASRDTSIVRDVRIAIRQLCVARIVGGSEGDSIDATVRRWFASEVSSVAEIRRLGIFHKITRTNARPVLRSLLAWLASTDVGGSLVCIDARRLAVGRRRSDGVRWYTKPALLDAYEVMREFVDSVDELRNVIIIFMMDRDFLDVDPHGRGMGAYDALRYRVNDEVQDRSKPNPLATLVRLTGPNVHS